MTSTEYTNSEAAKQDFEKSLSSSTPKHSASVRSRKTGSVASDTENSTFYKEVLPDQPETEWERWILRKAKELSFSQEREKENRKEERRKRRELKRANRDKLKMQEKVIEDWKAKKLEEHKERVVAELEKQREDKEKKAFEKEEILEKSVLARKEWKQIKTEKLKDCEAKKIAEEEKLARLKEERRIKAKQKYEDWLKNHQPVPSNKPANRPKTLSDVYSSPTSRPNTAPWVNGTDISYEKVKVLYTPFL